MAAKITELGREARHGATVRDVRVEVPGAQAIEAYLVEAAGEPAEGSGTDGAGVLFAHWFADEPGADRTQFLDEAAELAGPGARSILPQLRFPWSEDPSGAAHDRAAIEAQVLALRACLDVLEAEGADRDRLGFVGHDFGAMHGALLARDDRRPAAYVLMAATPRWGDWFLPFWRIDGPRHAYLEALADLDPITHVGTLAPAPALFQFARHDFFIAGMTGQELFRAASEPRELRAYDAEHDLRHPAARADRRAFLERTLGLG